MSTLLGCFHAAAAVLNVVVAVVWLRSCLKLRRAGDSRTTVAVQAIAAVVVAAIFGMLALSSFQGTPPGMPESVKAAVDAILGPVVVTVLAFAMLAGFYLGRRWVTRPEVGLGGLNVALLLTGLSLADPVFASVVTKPDNVPIAVMIYLLGFFVWHAAGQAVRNDERLAQGGTPVEKDLDQKVLVWPDLVYTELICMILVMALLIAWSLLLQAPLEEPANPVVTPNPSKAPWYFLGLQEMLVFFDASIAGVTLPVLIIIGLAAIPYLDTNPKGSGYYTISERKFAYVVFLFGFLQLWILLILIGTFMRGPNWNFFGLYEPRDPHKVLALNNIKLSEYLWVFWLQTGVPQVAPDAGLLGRLTTIALRESLGLVSLGVYFIASPVLLARAAMKDFRQKMGLWRYTLMSLLLLMMLMLPIKMILRWTMNLSYIVSVPEYFFNF